MGDIFLVDLAAWLRGAGLDVRELDDWKYRSRGSGGYDNMPLCVMHHHTASSGGDGENDAHYCTFGDSDAPLTNLVIGDTGIVWVCAAGATNCNGKGDAQTFSRGTVSSDSMNYVAVAIELSNNGVGGAYSRDQIDALLAASNVVNSHCGNQPDDVMTHVGYAPTRKVDPATAAAVQGDWHPRSINSSGSWNVEDLKAECRRRASGGTTEEEEVTDDDIERIAKRAAELVWAFKIDTTGPDYGDAEPAKLLLDRTFNTVNRIEKNL